MKARVYPSTVKGAKQSLVAPATTLVGNLPDGVPTAFEHPEVFLEIELTSESTYKDLNVTKALRDIEFRGYHIATVDIDIIAEWDSK